MTIRWVRVLLSIATLAMPILAHHSMNKEFDTSRHVTVTGIITKLDWTNPHIWIYLDVQDASKNTVAWGIQSAPPGALQGKGIGAASLKVGTRVTVEGFPAVQTNATKMSGVSLTLPNGQQLDIRDTWPLLTLPR